MLGEFGITAGSGMDGAGEADRRIDGEEPKDDRRLCEVGGGCICNGRDKDCGVPGMEGIGEPMARAESAAKDARLPKSGGAGLLDDTLRAGRSIFADLLCCSNVNRPSFVFRV